jgi:hypothetical protein
MATIILNDFGTPGVAVRSEPIVGVYDETT